MSFRQRRRFRPNYDIRPPRREPNPNRYPPRYRNSRSRFRRTSIAIPLSSTKRNNPWSSIVGTRRRVAPPNRQDNRNMPRNISSNSRRYNQRDTRWSSNYKVQQRANAVYRRNSSYRNPNSTTYNQRRDIRREPIYKDVWNWDMGRNYRNDTYYRPPQAPRPQSQLRSQSQPQRQPQPQPQAPRVSSWKRKRRAIQSSRRNAPPPANNSYTQNSYTKRDPPPSANNSYTKRNSPPANNSYTKRNRNNNSEPYRAAPRDTIKTYVAPKSNASYTNQESKATQSNKTRLNVPSSKPAKAKTKSSNPPTTTAPKTPATAPKTKAKAKEKAKAIPNNAARTYNAPPVPPPIKAPIIPRKSPPKLKKRQNKRSVKSVRHVPKRAPAVTRTTVLIGHAAAPPSYVPLPPRTTTHVNRSLRTYSAPVPSYVPPVTSRTMPPVTFTSTYSGISRNVVNMTHTPPRYTPLATSQPNIVPNSGISMAMTPPTYSPTKSSYAHTLSRTSGIVMHAPPMYAPRPPTPTKHNNHTPPLQRTPPQRTPPTYAPRGVPSSSKTTTARSPPHHIRRIVAAVSPPTYAPTSTPTPKPPTAKVAIKKAAKPKSKPIPKKTASAPRIPPKHVRKAPRRTSGTRTRKAAEEDQLTGRSGVYVIGRNNYYQFGLDHKEKIPELTQWKRPSGKELEVEEINISLAGLILTDSDGCYWSMGCNQHGECAIPNKGNGYVTKPTEIEFFKQNKIGINKIFTNTNGWSVFWMTNHNEIYGNGYNESHQLGVGDTEHKFVPTRILSLEKIVKMTSADRYSLALDVEGNVFSTTHSLYGGNAHGSYKKDGNYGWKCISSLKGIKIIDIDNGDEHSLFLSVDGIVYGVGRGDHERLGNGLRGANQAIFPVPYFKNNKILIKQIACGRAHNLCIDQNDCVWSWGCNFLGQCGDHTFNTYTPKMISYLKAKKIVDIKCGTEHSYVRTDRQQHFLFGSNQYNECSLVDMGAPSISTPYIINHVVKNKFKSKTNWGIKEVYLGANSTMIIVADLTAASVRKQHSNADAKREVKHVVKVKAPSKTHNNNNNNHNNQASIKNMNSKVQNHNNYNNTQIKKAIPRKTIVKDERKVGKRIIVANAKDERQAVKQMIVKEEKNDPHPVAVQKPNLVVTKKKAIAMVKPVTTKAKAKAKAMAKPVTKEVRKLKEIKKNDKILQLETILTSNKQSIAALNTELTDKDQEILTLNEKLKSSQQQYIEYMERIESEKESERQTIEKERKEKEEQELLKCIKLDSELQKIKQLRRQMEEEKSRRENEAEIDLHDELQQIKQFEDEMHEEQKSKQQSRSHSQQLIMNSSNNVNDMQLTLQDDDDDEKGGDDEEYYNDAVQLLKKWQLEQYTNILIHEMGYDDIEDWKEISMRELKDQMKFKPGHAKRFSRKRNELFQDSK